MHWCDSVEMIFFIVIKKLGFFNEDNWICTHFSSIKSYHIIVMCKIVYVHLNVTGLTWCKNFVPQMKTKVCTCTCIYSIRSCLHLSKVERWQLRKSSWKIETHTTHSLHLFLALFDRKYRKLGVMPCTVVFVIMPSAFKYKWKLYIMQLKF
jgi:phosphatidylserine synthase